MIWRTVKHFSPREKWGDPHKVSGLLVLSLDATRDVYGEDPTLYSFVLHCAYELSGHSDKSLHYEGKAADFHVRSNGRPPDTFVQQVLLMTKALGNLQLSEHVGLGIYPQWNSPGFHFDVRGERARWGWLDGKQVSFQDALMYARQKNVIGPY